MEALHDARLGVFGGQFHLGAGNQQPRLAEELSDALLEVLHALLILVTLVRKNSANIFFLRGVDVLADVFLGLLDHQQVAQQPVVLRQHHQQFALVER